MMQLKKIILLCFLVGTVTTVVAEDKVTYGLYENVKVIALGNKEIPAKLDTGASTASLNAKNIKVFEKNGTKWVRFTPVVKGQSFVAMEQPLLGVSKIKRRAADVDDEDESTDRYTKRPLIELQVCIGNTLKTIEVNLTDRSAFRFPLLIGSKALREFNAVVDPSLKYQSKVSCSVK